MDCQFGSLRIAMKVREPFGIFLVWSFDNIFQLAWIEEDFCNIYWSLNV